MSGLPTTLIDLYRIGDLAGAALAAVRIDIDVTVFTGPDGGIWVRGTPNGGASMTSAPYRLRRPQTSRWWRLPAGSPYPGILTLRHDHGSHWMFEPCKDMPLGDYLAALRSVNNLFV
jgi:hypothetical protein